MQQYVKKSGLWNELSDGPNKRLAVFYVTHFKTQMSVGIKVPVLTLSCGTYVSFLLSNERVLRAFNDTFFTYCFIS